MKASKWIVIALSVVMALALVGCGGTTDTDTATGGATDGPEALSGFMTVEGSDTMVNIGQALAEDFMAENGEVMITVKGGGSGGGIAALLNGTVDLANSSRDIKDEEIEQAKGLGVDPVETVIGLDGIAVIVHLDNPVQDLTLEDLGAVYRGEITNWKDLGGNDAPIVLIGRDTSSGTYEFFAEAAVGKDNEYSKEMRNLQSSQAIVDEVAGNVNAIGYVGMGYIAPEIHVVALDGVDGTVENVKNKSYPLSRGLNMYSNGTPTGIVAAYLEWILGPTGQAIIEAEGFVGL